MISLVLPVYNEGDGALRFLQALENYLHTLSHEVFEIVIVDDGSTDATKTVLKNYHSQFPCRLIVFSRNFGKECAISAGLAHAEGDAVIIMDSDFQHPFELISKMIFSWKVENYDMVYTIQKDRTSDTFLKRILTKLFYKIVNTGGGPKLQVNAGDFRLMSRAVINAILSCPENIRFMKGLYAWVGFRSKPIEYLAENRRFGKTKWSFLKLFHFAVDGITSFTDLPLRIWTIIGFFIALIALLYGTCNFLEALFFGNKVPGYPTIVSSIFFFGGVQLVSIGILGEYLSKVFREVKNRPIYIVKEIVTL